MPDELTMVLDAVGVVPAGVPALGPSHANVAPVVEEEPESVTEVAAQVNVCPAPAFALGVVVLVFTVTTAVAVHPLLGSVTVNV